MRIINISSPGTCVSYLDCLHVEPKRSLVFKQVECVGWFADMEIWKEMSLAVLCDTGEVETVVLRSLLEDIMFVVQV